MIKVGIYGPDAVSDPVRKQLLRLLLRHPDVDLRCVASPAGNAMPLAELHPVYAGETNLTLERLLDLSGLDVLFVIDEENVTPEIMEKFESDNDFRLIIMGEGQPERYVTDEKIVYGFPEWNRKAMVRGARAARCASPEALLIETALFPLAKNALLPDNIECVMATDTRILPALHEVQALIPMIQRDWKGNISLTNVPAAPFERLDLTVTLQTPIALDEIERLFNTTYDDHNFVYIVPGHGPIDEDLRGSNKCLIRLSKEGETLTIHASMDTLTKGITGNAVHIMNLLFGLYERTGLSI